MPTDDDVPESAEGRQILLNRVAEFKSSGDSEEAARSLLQLAWLVKQIGPVTEKPWYLEYMEYVQEAHLLLDGSTNERLLASAHRAVSNPFVVDPAEAKKHLQIALQLSEGVGDHEGRGHALLQLSHLSRSKDGAHLLLQQQAYEAFELAGSS